MATEENSMKISKDYPPNFNKIKETFFVTHGMCYCYGDTIYSPDNQNIREDIIEHEHIHSIRQGDNPDLWWNKYLEDKDFRLKEELIAYAHQFNFSKQQYNPKDVLYTLASDLSTCYGLDIDHRKAEAMIRLEAKQIK